MAEELRQKAISGAKWRLLATYCSQFVQMGGAIVLAWLLNKNDYGLMAGAMVVISLIRGCTNLGMNYAIVQRRDRVDDAVNTGFTLLVILAVFSYVVMVVAAPFSKAYRIDAALMWTLGLLFFLRPMGIVTEGTFFRQFHFRRLFVVEFASVALSVGIAIAMAAALPSGKGYWALAISGLAREAFRSAIGWLYAPMRPKLRIDWGIAKELLHYGKYLWAGAVVMVLYGNIERLALLEMVSVGALGLYHFAHAWVTRVGKISETIFGAVAISVYAKLQDDLERLRTSYCRIVGYSAVVSTGLLTGLAMLAPEAVTLAFPMRWRLAIPMFQVLGLFYIVRAIDTTTGQLYVAVGKTKLNMYLGIVNAVAMLVTIVPLVWWQGMVGAAYCVLVARLVTMACNAFVLRRTLQCPMSRLVRIVVPGVKASLVMACVLAGAQIAALRQFGHIGWLMLAALVAIGSASFAASMFVMERELFWEVLGLVRDALRGRKVGANGLAS